MVLPSRAGRDGSLQLIKPLIFSIVQARVRKLLLPETLTRKCQEPLRISELTLMPTVTRLISFQTHHLVEILLLLLFCRGSGPPSPGNDQPGWGPSVGWALPPSPARLIANRS